MVLISGPVMDSTCSTNTKYQMLKTNTKNQMTNVKYRDLGWLFVSSPRCQLSANDKC